MKPEIFFVVITSRMDGSPIRLIGPIFDNNKENAIEEARNVLKLDENIFKVDALTPQRFDLLKQLEADQS